MKAETKSGKTRLNQSVISVVWALFVVSGIAGCSSSMKTLKKHIPFMEPDTNMTLTLAASPDINPDQIGEASPLNVKTYLLTERTTFDNLGFESALDEAGVILSSQLLSTKEYIFQPKESIQYAIKLGKETKFIAIVAAYRDMDKSKWKLVVPVDSEDPEDHTVNLTRESVILAKITEEDDQEDNTIDVLEDKVTGKAEDMAEEKLQDTASEYFDSKLDNSF